MTLADLADAVDAILAGDHSRRVPVSGTEDVRRLARAFNAMLDVQGQRPAVAAENRPAVETSRLNSAFVAHLSHELRTPLNVIIGFAELMHDGKVGPVSPQHQECLGDILTSSKHLLRVINDALDLARVASGTMELHPEPVDVQHMVVELRDILRERTAAKQIRILTDVDATVRSVVIDRARLKQILYNYLSNAIKFTPDRGQVLIRIAAEGEARFRIDVEDNGIGIAADDLSRLFVEFPKLEGKRHQGTGLGLALSKRFAELLGGRVEVISTPGAGSTFSVVLPRPPATPDPDTGP